jgi:hypothetical protein
MEATGSCHRRAPTQTRALENIGGKLALSAAAVASGTARSRITLYSSPISAIGHGGWGKPSTLARLVKIRRLPASEAKGCVESLGLRMLRWALRISESVHDDP